MNAPALSMPVEPPPTTTTFRAPSSTSAGSLSAASHFRKTCSLRRTASGSVYSGALDAEEGDFGAERQHQVVVSDRGHLPQLHLAPSQVDAGDGRHVDR